MHRCKILVTILALSGCQLTEETARRQPDPPAARSASTDAPGPPVTLQDYIRQIRRSFSDGFDGKGDFRGKKCDVLVKQPIGGPVTEVIARPGGSADLCNAAIATIAELNRAGKFPVNPVKETVEVVLDIRP